MTAPATGRGAHRGSGGFCSTGQTGPAVTVPVTLGGPPAGETAGDGSGGRDPSLGEPQAATIAKARSGSILAMFT